MSFTDLIYSGQPFPVLKQFLIAQCGIFQEKPGLLSSPYTVGSNVTPDNFRLFLSVIQGCSVQITPDNICNLRKLAQEFKVAGLCDRIFLDDRITELEKSLRSFSRSAETRLSKVESFPTAFESLQAEVRARGMMLPDLATLPKTEEDVTDVVDSLTKSEQFTTAVKITTRTSQNAACHLVSRDVGAFRSEPVENKAFNFSFYLKDFVSAGIR
jgi:hypothetical protein